MLAADVGGFFAQNFQPGPGDPIPDFDSAFRRPLDQFQWRVALHWYWFRNIGLLSLMFRETEVPVLGVVENMSYFVCPESGKQYDLILVSGFRVIGLPSLLVSRLFEKACILKADSPWFTRR